MAHTLRSLVRSSAFSVVGALVTSCSDATGDVLTLAEHPEPTALDATASDVAAGDAAADSDQGASDAAADVLWGADGDLADAATPKCLGLFCLGSLVCCQNSASSDYGKCAPPPPNGCK